MKLNSFLRIGAPMLLSATYARAQDPSVLAQPPAAPGEAHHQGPPEREREPEPMKKLLWLDAEVGFATADINTFTADLNSMAVGFKGHSGTGPVAGAAIGVRFVFVTLGVRGRVTSLTGWSMSSVDGELGFRVTFRRFEPYMTIAAGYTALGGGGLQDPSSSTPVELNGLNARLGLGLDYFVSRYVSLGGGLGGEALAFTRSGVPLSGVQQTHTIQEGEARLRDAAGSSYGGAVTLTGGVKAHF
jgi:hypothetical protein